MPPNPQTIGIDSGEFSTFMRQVQQIQTSIKSLQRTLDKLNKKPVKIDFNFKELGQLNQFIQVSSRAKVNAIKDIVDNMERLSDIKISESKIGNLTQLFGALKNISQLNIKSSGIVASIEAINTLDISSGNIEKVTKSITKMGTAFTKIAAAGQGDPTKALYGIVELMNNLNNVKPSENVDRLVRVIGRLGDGFKKIRAAFNELDKTSSGLSAKKVGGFIATLQLILQLVGVVSSKLPGAQAADNLSKLIQRLGIGLSSMFRVVGSMNFENAKKISLVITTIAGITRLASKIVGDSPKIKALADVFNSISRLLQVLFTGIKVQSQIDSRAFSKIVKERIQFILEVLNGLRRINGKKIGGIGEAITGIALLIDKVVSIDFGGKDLNTPVTFIRNLIKSLEGLNKLKVNKNLGASLLGLGNVFDRGGADNQRVLKSGFGFGINLSNEFAKGFIKGTFAVRIIDAIVRIFAQLNPITLTKRFVEGITNAFITLRTSVTQILNDIVAKARQVGQDLSRIGRDLINNFGLSKLAGSGTFAIAAEFDDLANRAQVAGDLTEEEHKRILELSDTIGIDYPQSANEALRAIINLEKAGLGVPAIEEAIRPIADLAALSESGDISNASNAIIQAVSTFAEFAPGIEANFANANIAANILSRAADNSTASVESLQQGLANVGPSASAFGLTMEETTAILALFEDAGLRGAEGGTKLKSMLLNLARPTNSVRSALSELGVSLTDADGNFRDLDAILNDMRESMSAVRTVMATVGPVTDDQSDRLKLATKAYEAASRQIAIYQDGLSTGAVNDATAARNLAKYQEVQANAQNVIADITGSQQEAERIAVQIQRTQLENFETVQTIFGSYGQAGANVLLAEDTDVIANFVDEMNRLPSAAERAQVIMSSFNGRVEQLRGTLETLGKEVLFPLIAEFWRPLIEIALLTSNSILKLDESVFEFIGTFITIGATVATVVGAFLLFMGTVIQVGAVVLGFITSLLTIGTVLTTVVAGITAFVAGLIAITVTVGVIITAIGLVSAAFRTLATIFTDNLGGATTAVEFLHEVIVSLGEPIRELIGDIRDLFAAFSGISGGTGTSLESLGARIAGFITSFAYSIGQLRFLIADFAEIVRGFTSFLNVGFALNTNQLLENPLMAAILGLGGFEQSGQGIAEFFAFARRNVELLRDGITTIGSSISNFISTIATGGTFAEAFAVFRDTLADGFSKALAGLFTVIQRFFNIDLSQAIELLNVGQLGAAVKNLVARLFENISEVLLENRDSIRDVLATVIKTLFIPGGFLGSLFRFLGLEQVAGIFDQLNSIILNSIKGIIDTIFNLIAGQDFTTALSNAFGGDAVRPLLKFLDTLRGVVDSIFGIIGDLLGALSSDAGVEGGSFNLLDIVNSVLTFLTDNLEALNRNVLQPLRDIIRSVDFSGLIALFKNLITGVSELLRFAFSGDFTALENVGQAIGNMIGLLVDALVTNLSSIAGFAGNALKALSEAIGLLLQGAFDAVNLGGIGDFIGRVFSGLGDFFRTFVSNPGQFLTDVANSIAEFVATAVENAFSSLLDFLDIDVSEIETAINTGVGAIKDSFNKIFSGDDKDGGIFADAVRLFENIKVAINNLLTPLSSIGSTVSGDLGKKFQEAFRVFVDLLARLADLGLETLLTPLETVSELVDAFADIPPENLDATARGFLFLAGSFLAVTRFKDIVSFLIKLGTTISGLVYRAAGMFAVFLIIKNVADNVAILVDVLTKLGDLDIAGVFGGLFDFFGQTATGITFDILGLLGINTLFGQTEEQIRNTVSLIADGIPIILRVAGDEISKFYNDNIVPVLNVIQQLVSIGLQFAGNVIALGARVAESPAKIIQGVVDAFNEFDVEKQQRIVTLLGAIAAGILLIKGASVIASLGGPSGIFQTLTSAFSGTSGAAGGLASKLYGLVGPIIAITAFSGLLIGFAENIDTVTEMFSDLIDLDIAGFISNMAESIGGIAVDGVFAIANVFGITELFGQTEDEFHATVDRMGVLVELWAFQITNSVKGFFDALFQNLREGLQEFGAAVAVEVFRTKGAVDSALGVEGGNEFTAVDQLFTPENIDTIAFQQALLDPYNFDPAILSAFAQANGDKVIDSLTGYLASGGQINAETFKFLSDNALMDNFVRGMSNAIQDYDPSRWDNTVDFMFQSLSNAFVIDPNREFVNQGTIDQIAAQIQGQLNQNLIDPEKAILVLDQLKFSVPSDLSTAEIENVQQSAQAKIDKMAEIQADAIAVAEGSAQPAEVAVPVDVDPQVDPEQVTTSTTQAVDDATALQIVRDGPPVQVPVDVDPIPNVNIVGFLDSLSGGLSAAAESIRPEVSAPMEVPGFENVQTPQDISEMNTQLSLLQLNIDETNLALQTLPEEISPIVQPLNDLSLAVTTAAETMITQGDIITTRVALIETSIVTSFTNILAKFTGYSSATTGMAGASAALLGSVAITFPLIQVTIVGAINTITTNIQTLTTTLNGLISLLAAVTAAANLAATALSNVGGGGGGGSASSGGRADGGPVWQGGLFEVAENKMPEILLQNGRAYLIPGGPGMVVPLQQVKGGTSQQNAIPQAAVPQRLSPSANQTLVGAARQNNVQITEGTINININGGDFGNQNELIDRMRQEVRQEIRNNRDANINEILRSSAL